MKTSFMALVVILAVIFLAGCSDMAYRYSDACPPAPYGRPDNVSYSHNEYFRSVTYIYRCLPMSSEMLESLKADPTLHGKYVSVTYNQESFYPWDFPVIYKSTGVCQ
jgi:hypothetical protein